MDCVRRFGRGRREEIGRARARSFAFALVGSVVALMGTMTLLALPAGATGTTLYVGGDGIDSGNNCQSAAAYCKTISHAVAEAATGDTIDVINAFGTVFDNVTIPGSLTNLTIDNGVSGPAAPAVVDGDSAGPVFTVDYGASVTISDLTIQHGVASASNGYNGGGIVNAGTLTLNNDTITSNTALYGGGGVWNDGTLTVDSSTMSDNTASANPNNGGGALFNYGSATSTNDTYADNASPDGGAALFVSGTFRSTGDTFSDNTSTYGGAAAFTGGTEHLSDDTLSGNTATGSGGGFFESGSGASTILSNDTVANNIAPNGGAFWANAVGLQLTGTVIGINYETQSPYQDCAPTVTGAIVDNGYNLNDDGTCGFTASTSISGVDPQLNPLGNYGGPTQTMPPAVGSPILDRIPAGGPGCPGTDQRGVPRPQGSACDMGAVELALPQAQPFSYSTKSAKTLTVAAPGLQSGATDPIPGATIARATQVGLAAHGVATVNADGSFSYIPDAGYAGPDSFLYTVTDNYGFTSAAAAVYIGVGLYITTTTLPTATRGVTYSASLYANGGKTPFTWKSINALPSGLTLNTSTGVISGNPATTLKANAYKVKIEATDSTRPAHLTSTVTLSIDVLPNLYVTDHDAGTIVKITPNGVRTTVATGLNQPNGVAEDAEGNLYVSEAGAGRVDKINPAKVKTVIIKKLHAPSRVAVDAQGDVFVADTGDGTVVERPVHGAQKVVVTGISTPVGVAVDGTGTLYVADGSGNTLYMVSPGGTPTAIPGLTLQGPGGVTLDGQGGIYVADYDDSSVQYISPSDVQSTVPVSGLYQPNDVAVDYLDTVSIADYTLGEVVQRSSDGSQSTIEFSGANCVAVGS
jgi:hypothetical protein